MSSNTSRLTNTFSYSGDKSAFMVVNKNTNSNLINNYTNSTEEYTRADILLENKRTERKQAFGCIKRLFKSKNL